MSSLSLALVFFLAVSVLGAAAEEAVFEHPIGSGPEDWWITYPDQHSYAGSSVEHPSWALDPLEERPVMILFHSSHCAACVQQEAAIMRVLGALGDEVAYQDVLTESEYEKGWGGLLVYYPQGDPRTDPIYVPLTVFLTLGPGPGGGTEVVWHSAVGSTGERRIRSYLSDAVARYDEASRSWEG